jgi:protoporphyrinogen/coproporphyrinogen III oxidase
MIPRVVVVGGGVAGLATGWFLAQSGRVDVTVLESTDRLGGKLMTGEFAGRTVEFGADAFLARHRHAQDLAVRLGLGDDLVAPATGRVWLWSRGRLRPLPEGTVLGAPADPVALVRSGVLPPGALLRAAVEPLVPHRKVAGDRSVADVIAERFGPAVVDTLVEPLLGGVYAGRADALSVESAAPVIADAARSGSLLTGLWRHRRGQVGATTGEPVFQTLRGGLSDLTTALADDLGDAVRTGVEVTAVEPAGTGWWLDTSDGTVAADAVVFATPAWVTADLIAGLAPPAGAELAGIPYASVAVVTLAYDRAADRELPQGSGMLVPRSEGRLVKASTWVSRKWPQHADADVLLVRASVGRIDDDRWRALDEDDLVRRVDAELRWATGISRPAVDAVVTRWERSLPQYGVGHRQRVERIRHHLPWGLFLAGAAYDGVGISPCVASAERAAQGVLARLKRAGR